MADTGTLKIIIGAVIAVGIVSGGIFAGPTATQSDVAFSSDVEFSGVPEATGGTSITSLSVDSGLNDAVSLSGAPDSAVEINESVSVDDTWSLCTVASADGAVVANDERRALAGAAGGTLYYDGGADAWTLWYYNETSRQSYAASVSAPTPTSQTLVCGEFNGTHLRVSTNTTVGPAVSTSGPGGAVAPPSENWHGVIDETRIFDSRLNDSQRQEFVSAPGQTVTGQIPTARLTYDVRERPDPGLFGFGGSRYNDSVSVYFAGQSAAATNISYVDGVDSPSISAGADYEFRDENETIALTDGELAPGDVVYLSWDYANSFARTLVNIGIGLGLLGLLAIPLLARLE